MRSPALLALALAMLASSGGLALLVHDAELGTDEAALADAKPGDPVRLKGELVPTDRPHGDLADAFGRHLARLSGDGFDATVLLTADQELPRDGTWIVEATVVYTDVARSGIIVLAVDALQEPYVFG